MKIKILLLILGSLFVIRWASADDHLIFPSHVMENIVGTIESIDLNTIELWDEKEKCSKRFIYMFSDIGQFKTGDRVRIYFRLGSSVIESIKKMTPVEYIKGKQNAGFIYKTD